jgi:hypothetical protein
MTAISVTMNQLQEDPVLCEKLIGSQLRVELTTSSEPMIGNLLHADIANGRTLTLLVKDKPTVWHIIIIFNDCISSMKCESLTEDRLTKQELALFRLNSHFIAM